MATSKPRVITALAEAKPRKTRYVLPGSAVGLKETALFARTNGYLKDYYADIGDSVKAGQLLAEIEAPEIDAELDQARAVLAESKATLERNKASAELSRINLKRAQRLLATASASRQEYDDAAMGVEVADADIHLAEAQIRANEARVRRLEKLKSFQQVTAPFDGVVTARRYDPGALIDADNPAANFELFRIAQIDTLRVFVDIPQVYATEIQPDQEAVVYRRDEPGHPFPGKVARTTRSLDPISRTMKAEVHVPNPDGELLPGMYVQVALQFPQETAVQVPSAALITRAEGNKVAILAEDGSIRYQPVEVGRDYGASIEIVDGLRGGETLAIRPGDDLEEGTLVEAVARPSTN